MAICMHEIRRKLGDGVIRTEPGRYSADIDSERVRSRTRPALEPEVRWWAEKRIELVKRSVHCLSRGAPPG